MTDQSKAPADTLRATPPGGMSGKRVTTWVVVALVVIGVAISFTLWTYNRLDAARAGSAAAWRTATVALDNRYRVLEQKLADAVAAGAITEDFQRRFDSASDRFRTTSIVVEQVAAAEQLEQLLGSSDFPGDILQAAPPTQQLVSQLDEYNRQRLHERVLRESFGGKLLELFLSLPPSTPFRLSAQP